MSINNGFTCKSCGARDSALDDICKTTGSGVHVAVPTPTAVDAYKAQRTRLLGDLESAIQTAARIRRFEDVEALLRVRTFLRYDDTCAREAAFGAAPNVAGDRSHGIALSPTAWTRLDELTRLNGTTRSTEIERLVRETIGCDW